MPQDYSYIKVTTAGEHLFKRIATITHGDLARMRLRDQLFVRVSGRGEAFGDYLEGAVVAFAFKRALKAAKGLAEIEAADAAKYLRRLEGYFGDWFHWLSRDELAALVRDAKRAQEASTRDIPKSLNKEIFGARNVHYCCFCGDTLSRGPGGAFFDPSGRRADLEHVWPQSLGGDSVEANLVPACHDCNGTKADLFVWEDGMAHSMVYPIGFENSTFLPRVPLVQRLLLQRRAVITLAQRDRLTLKDALVRVGPYGELKPVDSNDTWDFFNVQNHATALGERLW